MVLGLMLVGPWVLGKGDGEMGWDEGMVPTMRIAWGEGMGLLRFGLGSYL